MKTTLLITYSFLSLASLLHAQATTPSAPATTNSATSAINQPQPDASPETIGDTMFARGRYQAAIEAFKNVTPPTANSWNKSGMSYQKMYSLDYAKNCYLNALKLEPRNTNLLNNLGTAYQGLKDYSAAERTYKKALKINPQEALVFKNLGTLYLSQGKIEKGKKAFDQARHINPEVFDSGGAVVIDEPTNIKGRGALNYMLARGCAQSGRTECAIQYLKNALDERYTTPKKLAADPDFLSLHDVYDFQRLIAPPVTPSTPPESVSPPASVNSSSQPVSH